MLGIEKVVPKIALIFVIIKLEYLKKVSNPKLIITEDKTTRLAFLG